MRAHLPIDQARLRPHLRVELKRQQAEHAPAVGGGADTTAPRWKTSAGDVDKEKLRGLPMIGPGIRGAQRGSDPLAETIRRSERRR